MRTLAGASALLAGVCQASAAQSAKPVPALDYARFTGPWYAVAQYRVKTKYPCAGPTTVLYALGDKPGTFQTGSFCSLIDGGSNDNQASGKLDKSHDGALKVRTIWPLSTKLLIVALAPDYSWAVIGSPNHKKLFILSRSPELPDPGMGEAKAQASAQGYNVSNLVAPPTPTAPPKVSPVP